MSRELVDRYRKAQDPFDPDALAGVRHPDWVAEWPQSGERIPGHEADVAIHTNFEGYPEHALQRMSGKQEKWALTPLLTPLRISGEGPLWVAEVNLTYGDDSKWFGVAILEVKEDKVWRETSYFFEPFDAPEWRASIASPIEAGWASIDLQGSADRVAENRASLERYLETARVDAAAAAKAFFAPQVMEDFPQSGERIAGLENVIAMMTQHPDRPMATLRRSWGLGNFLVIEVDIDYSGDHWVVVELLQFRDGKVVKSTEYFGQPFDPPERRKPWVELI